MIIPRPKESFCSSKLEYRVLLSFKWILFFTIALPCCISCSKVFVGEETPLLADFEAIEKGERVIFLNKSSSNATYYQLKIPNGSDVYYGNIKDTLATYTFSSNGLYDVKLQVKDKNGRQAEISKKIKVTQLKLGPVPVDSTLLVKPEFKIAYQVLDNGWVQFYDSTVRLKDYSWNTMWGYSINELKPKYWFPNGTQTIRFNGSYTDPEYPSLYLGIAKYVDTTFQIDITNSVPQVDTKRFVKGVIFGDSVNIEYDVYIQNSFLDNTFYGMSAPLANMPKIILSDGNESLGLDITSMRALYQTGNAPIAKFEIAKTTNGNFVIGRKLSAGWALFLTHKSNDRYEIAHSGMGHDQTLEIIDVKEIYQPPVFPGLETTAFIVTFRYKGLVWGQPTKTSSEVYPKIPGRDKVDLTFDVKFNVYPKGVF